MKRIVKCPLCGKMQQTRGRHYFKCCQMGWEVEKHQITSYDEGRYRVQVKPKPRNRTKLDIESIRPIIQEELEKWKQTEKRDKFIEKLEKDGLLRKGGYLRYQIKEHLKDQGIPFEDEE